MKNKSELLNKWRIRSKIFEEAHYRSATNCRIFNYCLGIPLVVFTTIIGTEMFAHFRDIVDKGLDQNGYGWHFYIVSSLTILAPILAGLQTFLRFPERAAHHKAAAVSYGLLKRTLEKTISCEPSEDKLIEKIEEIQKAEAQIIKEAPAIGSRSLKKVKRRKPTIFKKPGQAC